MQRSTAYILGFAAAVCLVCSIIVSGAAVALKERQDINKVLDRQKKVLSIAGLLKEGDSPDQAAVNKLFDDNIKAKVVDRKTGTYVDNIDVASFDQLKARNDPATSERPPSNMAKVLRVPNNMMIYHLVEGGKVKMLILPVEGYGLWGTLYGYLAIDPDLNTIKGITFYEHKETPGLGGEVDNPRWKALWPGRKLYDERGKLKFEVIKGQAGPVEKDPHRVDGLSGATITGRGVSHLIKFWLGEHGWGPYLKAFRKKGA